MFYLCFKDEFINEYKLDMLINSKDMNESKIKLIKIYGKIKDINSFIKIKFV